MTVRWTRTALRDLESLYAYVSIDNREAATDVVEALLAGIEALKKHPAMGRKGRVAGTRELVLPPYVVAYRLQKTVIQILSIIHGARRWPDSF